MEHLRYHGTQLTSMSLPCCCSAQSKEDVSGKPLVMTLTWVQVSACQPLHALGFMLWQLPEGLWIESPVMQALNCIFNSHAYCEPVESSADPLTFSPACPGGFATSHATSHGAGSSACLGCLADRQQPVRHASSDPPRPQQVPVSAASSACSRDETLRVPSSLLSSAASLAGSAQAIADTDHTAEANSCEAGTPCTALSSAKVAAAVLMDTAEAKHTTSEACAEPAAGASLRVSRSNTVTNDGHPQQNNAELCATTAVTDSTSGTDPETADMASVSAKRNNAPARLQQPQHLSSYHTSEEDRNPKLERQAAEQSDGESQHTVGSAVPAQQEPLLQPWRIAAQPHAVSLPQRRDGRGAPRMGAQQASKTGACDAPEARPTSRSLMLTRQGGGLGQQAAPWSPPRAAAWTDGGSAHGQAAPSQPVALADSAVMENFDQPFGATRVGQDVADQIREGDGLRSCAKCSITAEGGLRLNFHAACQAKENTCLDMLGSEALALMRPRLR